MPIPAVPALVAAAPAIASAISSAVNFISGNHANRANIRNQNELLKKQYQMQQELNANGALVQKQGLERAGMNVLSQFGPNVNLSAPTPSKSDIIAPQADLSGVAQMAQMMQQQPLVEAQVNKTKAEENYYQSLVPKNEADTQKTIQETVNLAIQAGILQFQSDTQKQQFEANMANLFADIDLKEAQTSGQQFENLIKGEKLDQERLETMFQNATFEQRKSLYLWTLKNLQADTRLKGAQRQQAVASANEALANASFTRAQENKLHALFSAEKNRIEQETATSREQQNLAIWQEDYFIAMAGLVKNQQDWYKYEEILKGVGCGSQFISSVADVLGTFRGTNFKVGVTKK